MGMGMGMEHGHGHGAWAWAWAWAWKRGSMEHGMGMEHGHGSMGMGMGMEAVQLLFCTSWDFDRLAVQYVFDQGRCSSVIRRLCSRLHVGVPHASVGRRNGRSVVPSLARRGPG